MVEAAGWTPASQALFVLGSSAYETLIAANSLILLLLTKAHPTADVRERENKLTHASDRCTFDAN